MGRAYGNIGNAYSAAGFYEQAIKYHKQELTISKEVHDRSSEASTHGNLAVAYQALGAHDMALFHYRAHLGKFLYFIRRFIVISKSPANLAFLPISKDDAFGYC